MPSKDRPELLIQSSIQDPFVGYFEANDGLLEFDGTVFFAKLESVKPPMWSRTWKTVALGISLTTIWTGSTFLPSSGSYIISPAFWTAFFFGPSHLAISSMLGTYFSADCKEPRLTVALRATIRMLGSAAFIRETTTSRVAPLVSLRKCTWSKQVSFRLID